MSTSLHTSTLRAPSTAAAVAYAGVVTAESTTAVVATAAALSEAADFVRDAAADSKRIVVLKQESEIASFVAASKGEAVNIVVPSSALVKVIPALRGFAREKTAVAIHVPVGSAGQLSEVLAVRDSGCALIRSADSPQSAVRFAVASALVSQKIGLPVIHCFQQAIAPEAVDVEAYEAMSEQQAIGDYLQQTDSEEASATETAHREFAAALSLFGAQDSPVSYVGAADATLAYATFGAAVADAVSGSSDPVGVVQISLLRPLSTAAVTAALPETASHVVALEQVTRQPTAWGPLLFDLAAVLSSGEWTGRPRPVILDAVTAAPLALFGPAKLGLVTAHSRTFTSPAHFDPAATAGIAGFAEADTEVVAPELGLEQQRERVERIPYGRMLQELFRERLSVANGAESATIWGDSTQSQTSPEFGFGRLAAFEKERAQLAQDVGAALRAVDEPLSAELHQALAAWLDGREDPAVATPAAAQRIGELLAAEMGDSPRLAALHQRRDAFCRRASWLVGADAWAYDIGSSGVHHVIASGLNIKMLVLDTTPHPFAAQRGAARKKDVGLYAMHYGAAYVASVAVYASYTQTLQALGEADAFPGPAVVVAYLPHSAGVFGATDSPIEVLQQSKQAVDAGAWPLYRWDPRNDDAKRFQLDSERLARTVEAFLARENALAAVGSAAPEFGGDVAASAERAAGARLAARARGDVDRLVGGLDGPPLLVLFASDGGNAEEAARRIARQARRRGMVARCVGMESADVDELAFERTVVISVSTAGQGEIPTAGREFLRALLAASANLSETSFAVFGLGDSHYWPRAEDALFYNKPARDIDRRLAELGARRIVELGLGDDQDADGWEAGFSAFEQRLWAALNVGEALVDASADDGEEAKRTDEENKVISNFLRGTISQALADDSTGAVGEWDAKLLKFHGTYMQDDRDLRGERVARGVEKAFSFMIRVRLPGGVATPAQWMAMDRLASEYGNETMKITTRQTFQLHGVLKRNLRETMRGINRALMDTLAACGDVNRNVVASANPQQPHLHTEVARLADDISSHLLPSTAAYHEIWLDDKLVAGDATQSSTVADSEPLYGAAYLPRKFKVAIAIPPENDVDVVAYDLGLIAILDDAERIVGYNVMVGGGMGMTHNNTKTYPRLASCLGFVAAEHAVAVSEAVMLVQRDHGDRSNRKHARLKYTVDDHGLPWWREQVAQRLGFALEPARPFAFTRNGDRFGWVRAAPGLNNYTIFVQNGRIANTPGFALKDALAAVAAVHTGAFRLTCNGNLIVADVPDADVPAISALLADLRLDNLDFSALRLHSMACAALPTCGLAMAEAERYLPHLIDRIDSILDSAGLRNDAIVLRMTGCPNGCARPYNAEIAFVGKAPGAYNLYLGGSHAGDRLNKLFRETLTEDQILEVLEPIIKRYALERLDAEHFGDFVIRAGIIKATREGLDFHDQ
ncbi:Sulfite reductase [NADPH] subunit beta [Coemansia sp. RSA 1200]|nr:Sulfite reductase [NADPH] subunit beta [Coemansia sp. RSA 1200]